MAEEVAAEIIEMASETVAGDLLKNVIAEYRSMPKPWASLGEVQQQQVIERLSDRVRQLVTTACRLIAAEKRVTVVADLESITIKDGTKAVLQLAKSQAVELADHVGGAVLIVIEGAQRHQGGTGEVRPDKEQRELDLKSAAERSAQEAAGELPPATGDATNAADIARDAIERAKGAGENGDENTDDQPPTRKKKDGDDADPLE